MYRELFVRATGVEPYPWQTKVAEQGLPEAFVGETGSGKTAGMVLGWLYRRRYHPEPDVRAATPRRLVFVLPMRTLVEQTVSAVENWLEQLSILGQVRLVTLMGGEPVDGSWRLHPEEDCIIVGTLDMVLSRCLNRGYGQSRYSWPIDFGLLNNDAHFVFDEVQLMGPAAKTSRQLQAFRERLGTAAPTSSTWMTATLDIGSLQTVDAPETPHPVTLSQADRDDNRLQQRLDAVRRVERWVSDPAKLADVKARAAALLDHHQPGTLTLVVLNTVAAARGLHDALRKLKPAAELVLLHSRFRHPERRQLLELLASPLPEAGRIVVSTQVVEAGIDISARLLATEAAPWTSIVQRLGRCNRDGRSADALVLWAPPSKPAPYEPDEVDRAVEQLELLTGTSVTTTSIGAVSVPSQPGFEASILRLRELLALFDTAPDLAGNDIDISRYVRPDDERDVLVLWRDGEEEAVDLGSPRRDELCSVPIGEFRDFAKKIATRRTKILAVDHTGRSAERRRESGAPWVPVSTTELRPGQVYLLPSSAGGYTTAGGWDPKSTAPVEPIQGPATGQLAPMDESIEQDPASAILPQGLAEHLHEVAEEAERNLRSLETPGLSEPMRQAVVAAARWHDLGKSHHTFQAAVRSASDDAPAGLLAKSGKKGQLRYDPRGFRHEFASALALLGAAGTVLDELDERQLAVYLVAAHHGKVRVTVRPTAFDEVVGDGPARLYGVTDGDRLPAVTVDGVTTPETVLSTDVVTLGADSWSAMTASLLHRSDLGPFRLAYLEALVRGADWRASARLASSAAERDVSGDESTVTARTQIEGVPQ